MATVYFNHSGNMGDILYSLYFCKEFVEARGLEKPKFNMQYGIRAVYPGKHPNGNFRLTKQAGEFIKPFLEATGLFTEITISDKPPMGCFNLDTFRKLGLSLDGASSITHWYYPLVPDHLPKKFYQPIFSKEVAKHDKIVVIRTDRYLNSKVDVSKLRYCRDRLLFLGTSDEHRALQAKIGPIEYKPINNLLEAAEILLGARGVIGNPSGLYSLAEVLKVPRIFICPLRTNVQPIGGWFEIIERTKNFDQALDRLCEK